MSDNKKLKTLKTLDEEWRKVYDEYHSGVVSVDDLKEAAREWIKQLDKDEQYVIDNPRPRPICEYDGQRIDAIKWFIKKFFNLDEDE